MRLIKSIIILFIFWLVMFSLSAIRFIPGNEFTSFTNRGTGLPIEEILRVGHIGPGDLIDAFIYPINPTSKAGAKRYGEIGLVGLALMIYSLYSYLKNKRYESRKEDIIIFLIISMVGITIFASGIFIELFYNLPGVSSQRGLDRSLIIFVLCGALLAGFGLKYLLDEFIKFKLNEKKIKILSYLVIFLVFISLFILNLPKIKQQNAEFESYTITEDNPIFLEIAEDKDIYRFHVIEVSGIDWNNFLGSSIPLGLESIYGTYGGGWDYRYFNEFLGATFRSPSKLWGMLNVKYLISSTELNQTDYTLVENFNDIPRGTISDNSYNNTAYLYQNKKFLPRAFIVPSSVLIVGQNEYAHQLMYASLINKNFDPSKTILIEGKESLSDYTYSEIESYDALLLTQGSVNQVSINTLKKYKENGGIIIPDILDEQSSLSDDDLSLLFIKLNDISKASSPIEITSYYDKTPNFMKISVNNKEDSFLFLSELYTLYPGWTAKIDDKETEILLTNGVLSSVFLPAGSKEVSFRYHPSSFRKGLVITSLALILLVIYFTWQFISRIFKKKTIV